MQTILLGRQTGDPKRIDAAMRGADEAFLSSQELNSVKPPRPKNASS
jgi:hypothetical protein